MENGLGSPRRHHTTHNSPEAVSMYNLILSVQSLVNSSVRDRIIASVVLRATPSCLSHHFPVSVGSSN